MHYLSGIARKWELVTNRGVAGTYLKTCLIQFIKGWANSLIKKTLKNRLSYNFCCDLPLLEDTVEMLKEAKVHMDGSCGLKVSHRTEIVNMQE